MTVLASGDAITEQVARALVDQIKGAVSSVRELIIEAWTLQAWIPLGYSSWDDLCDAEFNVRLAMTPPHRQQEVGALRDAGMSTRAIGSALGVDAKTVRNDLAGGESSPPATGQPTAKTVKGTDGKTYPRTKPVLPTVRPQATPTVQPTDKTSTVIAPIEPNSFKHMIDRIDALVDDGIGGLHANLDASSVRYSVRQQLDLIRAVNALVKSAASILSRVEDDPRMSEGLDRYRRPRDEPILD